MSAVSKATPIFASVALYACGAENVGTSIPAASGDVTVHPAVAHQSIDGFGAADVFAVGGALTPAQGQLFFDPVAGIGLSILRIGIDVDGTPLGGAAVFSDARLAASYGAIVWAAPWSPPAADKDNDSEVDGGHLCTAAGAGACTGDDRDAWATTLAGFAATLQQNTQGPDGGVALYGLSAQNEPDFSAPYVSCVYTAQQMVAFLKVLGPKLAALEPPVSLIAPEPESWSDLWGGADAYGAAIRADPAASAVVSIMATHDYGYAPVAPPAGVVQRIWETEVSGVLGRSPEITGPNVDIANGVLVAEWIYAALVTGGASAWHYWWLVGDPANKDNEGLLFETGQGPGDAGDVNEPPKRLFTVGNFSKFVRPGYERVDVSGSPPAGVQVVAFQNPADATLVIVAINSTAASATLPLVVDAAAWPSAVTPWVTSGSATENLSPQAPLMLSAGHFTAQLEAESVTTFVGKP